MLPPVGYYTDVADNQRQGLRLLETPDLQGATIASNSSFWIGLYGFNWIIAWHGCQAWVEELVGFSRNKQAYYQRGLRAYILQRVMALQKPLVV